MVPAPASATSAFANASATIWCPAAKRASASSNSTENSRSSNSDACDRNCRFLACCMVHELSKATAACLSILARCRSRALGSSDTLVDRANAVLFSTFGVPEEWTKWAAGSALDSSCHRVVPSTTPMKNATAVATNSVYFIVPDSPERRFELNRADCVVAKLAQKLYVLRRGKHFADSEFLREYASKHEPASAFGAICRFCMKGWNGWRAEGTNPTRTGGRGFAAVSQNTLPLHESQPAEQLGENPVN